MYEDGDNAYSDLGYGLTESDTSASDLAPKGEFSVEFEKFVDFAIGGRKDATSFYLDGDLDAGVRMRATTMMLEKYGKWLRMDSIAVAKGVERPAAFDWSSP